MKIDRSRVIMLVLGIIVLFLIPLAKRVGLSSSSPSARPPSQSSTVPTKSAQLKTRATAPKKGASQLDPFQRPKRAEGTPRVGEGGMIAKGLSLQLGLGPHEVLVAEEAVWTLREQMKELVREHSVVEIDGSDHSMVIRIDSFREDADLFLQELLVSLRVQLGEEQGEALFSYLDTASEFSAFGLKEVTIDLTLKGSGHRKEMFYSATNTCSGRHWLEGMDGPNLIGCYGDVFDSVVRDHFRPLLQEAKDDWLALIADREKNARTAVAASRSESTWTSNVVSEVVSSPSPEAIKADVVIANYRQEVEAYLPANFAYSAYRSLPEEGRFVFQIRARDDFATKEAQIVKDESEFVARWPQTGGFVTGEYRSFPRGFPNGPRSLTRDTTIEVFKNSEGEIESASYWQQDGRTGEFAGSGSLPPDSWLLQAAGIQ